MARPENEHKKLIRLSFSGIEIDNDESILHPFVISIEPNNTAYKAPEGILKKCSIFWIINVINVLFFISDITTEKIIINPPMFNIVVIELSIEFFTATPRLGEE